MELPDSLIDKVKAKAKKRGMMLYAAIAEALHAWLASSEEKQ